MWRSQQNNFNLTAWLIANLFPNQSHSLHVLFDQRVPVGGHRFRQVCTHQGGSSSGRRSVLHRRVSKVSCPLESEIFYSLFLISRRKSVELRGIDRSSKDDQYFRIREVNSTRIQIVLKESLDELVDNDTPHNIMKFKIQCNSAVQSNRRNHDVSAYESCRHYLPP